MGNAYYPVSNKSVFVSADPYSGGEMPKTVTIDGSSISREDLLEILELFDDANWDVFCEEIRKEDAEV